ncbi:MAG: phycobilisome rod-core linker polypeptide [Cyanobacteria bacterium J06626_18]
MISTFVNPTVNPDARLGIQPFDETDPIHLWSGASATEIQTVIRAIYRQVLGNAYVMESERLVVPESQLQRGALSVREFIRCLAKSELYRSRFFDNCYRYRSIEVNFKHLLGRAPNSFEEMKYHSAILDTDGYEADIDAYLDGDEYQVTFGENVVPYYRGYKTQPGQPLIGFTNTLQLLRSASSSDKGLASHNKPQLIRALLRQAPYGGARSRDANEIIQEALKPKFGVMGKRQSRPIGAEPSAMEQTLRQTITKQSQEIARLQEQLTDLRPLATIGATQLQDNWSPSVLSDAADESASLQQQVDQQTSQIATLTTQIADARRYATIADARLNKWRKRLYNG